MNLIDAEWDEKISGLKTCEILFEKSDSFKTYLDADIEKNVKFSVVKIPVGNLKLVHQLEDIGYRYLENQMVLSFNVEQLEQINSIWERLFKGFSYKLLTTREELVSITNQVSDKMFEADRYSQDPFWTDDLSSRRYVNWIYELFEKSQVRFYEMIKNGRKVGFFAIKNESEKSNSCPIAGIYNQYKFSGYIFVLVWYILIISREMGVNKFVTSISSNNRNLLSSFSKIFHFKVNETFIVLRKTIC
ncbi:MAG: hypothetical protein EPN88_09625 [Bacteroidetes bacterium]|nr:MAG: hypothetical protein EPN88_09625 [Bacteroidota bacterium]